MALIQAKDTGDYALAVLSSLPMERALAVLGKLSKAFKTTEKVIPSPEISAKTPTGSKGNPLNVPDGINKPVIIDNLNYSGHALDRMQRQGITPTAVNNAIKPENAVVGKRAGTTAYYDDKNNLTVITDTNSGTVITVDYGKIKQ